MLKKILVAYDSSASAEKAFDFALELAKPFGASVSVLSVARPPEPATMVETDAVLESAIEHFAEHYRSLQARAKEFGVKLTTKVLVGHPAEQIVHAADEERADLIVMGHRGKSMIEKWLLGSVSKRVITYAPCAVMVVR